MKTNQTIKEKLSCKFGLKTIFSLILVAILLTSFASYMVFSNPVSPNVYLDDLPATAYFTVKSDSTNYWTVRYDGYKASEGTTAHTIINNAIDGLSGYIFGCNITGSLINETWIILGGSPTEALVTTQKLLPMEGTIIQYLFYANDTDDNWATSETQTFQVGVFELQGSSYSSDKLVETYESPHVYFNTGESIGFQNDVDTWVIVNVTSGYLNSIDNNIGITQTGGYFIFQPDTTVSMQVIYSNITISQVRIDQGAILNGTITSFNTAQHEIEWLINTEYYTGPLLPFGFIMGMVGLVSMIGGSCYTVYKLKQKELDAAICVGFVMALVGYALFIGWLAMGI